MKLIYHVISQSKAKNTFTQNTRYSRPFVSRVTMWTLRFFFIIIIVFLHFSSIKSKQPTIQNQQQQRKYTTRSRYRLIVSVLHKYNSKICIQNYTN